MERLVQIWNVGSAGRQALKGAAIAPVRSLALTDPSKRPHNEAVPGPSLTKPDGGVRGIVVGDV